MPTAAAQSRSDDPDALRRRHRGAARQDLLRSGALGATVAVALALPLLAAAPAAAEAIVGVLGPTDHRVPVEPDKFPWSSIGRVNHEGNFCTGTTIAPREVLTAG